MGRTNRPETVFCQSCGERINREADVCPECGVANEYKPSTSGTETVFCHSCGAEIKKHAEVCPDCGVANTHKPSTSGTETVFCHSCGAEIKKQAEVCPECGIANTHKPSPTNGPTTTDSHKVKIPAPDASTTTGSHEQEQSVATDAANTPTQNGPTTTDEDEQYQSGMGTDTAPPLSKWSYLSALAVACGLIWTFTSAGFGFFFISWFLIPFALYHDAKHVQPATGWNPNRYLWAFLTLYPGLNIFIGLIYVIKRFNSSSGSLTDKISNAADSNTEECNECTDADSEDAAIDQLRKQYVNGELNDYEFERRLEKVVETEDTEAVKERIKEEA